MELASVFLGWAGVGISFFISIPQIIHLYKTQDSRGIAVLTYWLLTASIFCYLARAVYIGEWVFIVSNAVGFFTTAWVLYLTYKFKERYENS